MESKDIFLNENLEMYTALSGFNSQVCIILSDSLLASEEDLKEEYKTKIADFINNFNVWYNKSVNTILG